MNMHPAIAALEHSLRQPTATPCTWRPDREQYIAEKVTELRRHLIEPEPVRAVASEWAQKYAGRFPEVRHFYAIARHGDRWLLFDEDKKTFALAHGTDKTDEPVSLLGFESDDALAEWLG